MIRTVAIGSMIGAVGVLAGSALSGEITVTFYFGCLLGFIAVEATTRFVEIKLHKRFMEDIGAAEASLDARIMELGQLNPRFTLSTLHNGGRLQ